MCVPQEPAARITAVNALQHRFLADRPLIHSQLGRVKMRIDVPECDDEEGELQARVPSVTVGTVGMSMFPGCSIH